MWFKHFWRFKIFLTPHGDIYNVCGKFVVMTCKVTPMYRVFRNPLNNDFIFQVCEGYRSNTMGISFREKRCRLHKFGGFYDQSTSLKGTTPLEIKTYSKASWVTENGGLVANIVATQGGGLWLIGRMMVWVNPPKSPAEEEVGAAKVPLNCNLVDADESIWKDRVREKKLVWHLFLVFFVSLGLGQFLGWWSIVYIVQLHPSKCFFLVCFLLNLRSEICLDEITFKRYIANQWVVPLPK